MDTRFWGPSGWKLFHLITFDYNDNHIDNKKIYYDFFETLPFILPCKFCRASLTDYYRQYPFGKYNTLDSSLNLKKWMYNIHNCVNDKLRKQGLNPSVNPSYQKVKEFYEKWSKCSYEEQLSTFWDFLFAVAYNHPKETIHSSTPMPDCPPEIHKCKDNCEKNKWNVLCYTERLYWFRRFWHYLPAVLPRNIANKWTEAEKTNSPILDCRRSTLAWLWRMRCRLDTKFKDPYTSVCQKIANFSSDCGKKKKAITCRRRRYTSKSVRKNVK